MWYCEKRSLEISYNKRNTSRTLSKYTTSKQKEGESIEAFMEHFKAESMHVNEAPECMRVSRFMHDITNPDLIKRLNDNIPKLVDKMISMTTAFLRGEVAVAKESRKRAPPMWKHHEASHKPSFDKRTNLKNRQKSSQRHDRFTPLIKTPKEILAMDTVKFKAPPPMSGPTENRNKNKFCEFHRDKGHSTNECIHLKKNRGNGQVREAITPNQGAEAGKQQIRTLKSRQERGDP
ncbi:hypothetical protein Tco_0798422 [Tanacetum coccineum]